VQVGVLGVQGAFPVQPSTLLIGGSVWKNRLVLASSSKIVSTSPNPFFTSLMGLIWGVCSI
jgi:hypothetical protein